MVKKKPQIYFDRRVPGGMMQALTHGGFAHSLVEYARSGQYGLDLALRAGTTPKESHASLYVGTTKALDLHHRADKGFRLQAHKTWTDGSAWEERWTKWGSASRFENEWHEVEAFVEDCINRVVHNPKRSYLEEGTTQASVSRFGDGNPLVVDREAVVGFRDQPTKNRLLARSRRPLAKVLAAASKEPQYTWLKTGLTASECDLLAIDGGHELLAIEIKPASAKSWVTHAPLQAWQYAKQFQMWAQHCEEKGHDPRDIIGGMYAQRRQLGLETSARPFALGRPLVVRPAVAVRPGYSAKTRQRFADLVRLLRDTGLDEPAMRFYKVNLVGRLDPFDPLNPESWA